MKPLHKHPKLELHHYAVQIKIESCCPPMFQARVQITGEWILLALGAPLICLFDVRGPQNV